MHVTSSEHLNVNIKLGIISNKLIVAIFIQFPKDLPGGAEEIHDISNSYEPSFLTKTVREPSISVRAAGQSNQAECIKGQYVLL
jgi:hypothetical protein